MGIVFLLLAVISLFLVIYLLYLGGRAYGITQSIMITLIFLMSWVFLYCSAGVLDRRVGWLREATKLKDQLAKLEAEAITLKYGDLNRPVIELTSLVPVQNEIARLMLDRGRVWRNAQMAAQPNQAGITLRVPTGPPVIPVEGAEADPNAAAPAAAAPRPAGAPEPLPQGLVIYAFSETRNADGRSVPEAYLGEFQVVQSQNNEVLLRPTLPLQGNQAQLVNNTEYWTLYELLPLDSHAAFAEQGSQPTDSEAFGRMDPTFMENTFGKNPATLEQYIRDGQAATDADPDRFVWYRLKFLKEHTIDVDSQETRNAMDGGYFDTGGRTVDSRLKRIEDKPVTLKPGDLLLVQKGREADALVSDGVAEIVAKVFVRPLNDYEWAFQNIYDRTDEIIEDIRITQRETAVFEAANQLALEQTTFRQEEQQKVKADLEKFQAELAFITDKTQALDAKVKETTSMLSRYYNEIQGYHKMLVKQQSARADAAGTVAP